MPVTIRTTVRELAEQSKASPAAAPKSAPSVGALVALFTAGAVADLISTEIALRNPNVREGNPLAQTRASRAGLKVAEVAILTAATAAIGQKHPRGAALFAGAVFASRLGIAAWNLRQATKGAGT